MPTYRFVWATGYAAHMTVPQYEQACRIAQQWNLGSTVTVQPVFMMKDAVGIHTGSMYIAVLADGSSHS
jgi:hypothetical protein